MMDNKSSPMTQERIDLLNELGFVWNVQEMTWYQQLSNFKSFREEFGHSNVPGNCTKHRKLYHWMIVQRRQYVLMKRGEGSMTNARVKLLDSIGFYWGTYVPQCDQCSLSLQELQELDRHDHSVIPANLPKPHLETKWFANLEALKKYKQLNGDCVIPRVYPPNPFLGGWVRQFQERERTNQSSL
jgi:hypothetical protein